MRYKILILLFLPIFSFGQQYNFNQDSISLKTSAYKTLQNEMSKKDFEKLDWNKMKVDTVPKTTMLPYVKAIAAMNNSKEQTLNPLLIIPQKKDNSKIILYTEQNGTKYYNWVHLNLKTDSIFLSGNIDVLSIKNKLLHHWKIKKDIPIITDSTEQQTVNTYEGNEKVTRSYPNIISQSSLINELTKDTNNIFSFSLYYLLFNEKIDDYNVFSSMYFILNNDYRIILWEGMLGHYRLRKVEGIKATVQPVIDNTENN